MSTNRRGKWGPKGIGPNGRKLCYCGCGKEVPKGARTTATGACYPNWAKRHDPATQRRLVKDRDKGVCAECGVDTAKHAREASEWGMVIRWLARRHAEDLYWRGELPSSDPTREACYHDGYVWGRRWAEEEINKRFGETRGAQGHTWEADHIIPVIEGGGECDLSNLRTLCLPCHRKATAALAARRAQARKAAKEAAQQHLTLSL